MILSFFAKLFLGATLFSLFSSPGLTPGISTAQGSPLPFVPSFQDVNTFFDPVSFPVSKNREPSIHPVKTRADSLGVIISAQSAVVVDEKSGDMLFEKNSDEPRSIGSITKLMTALVFLEGIHPDLSASASVLPKDKQPGGVDHIGMQDPVSVHDLLFASLVGSDNTATMSLVRLSGKTKEEFVHQMNERAAQMGLQQTTFIDPVGLSPENRALPSDVVTLLSVALDQPLIREATETSSVSFSSASGRAYHISSTNELLKSFLNTPPYAIVGGKTGYLPEAGYCLAIKVQKDGGKDLYVVVLGSDTLLGRFRDSKALAAWAYEAYAWPSVDSSIPSSPASGGTPPNGGG